MFYCILYFQSQVLCFIAFCIFSARFHVFFTKFVFLKLGFMFDVLLLFSDLVYGSTCTSSDQCQTGLTCSNFVCECPEGTSFDGGSNMCMICKYDGHIDCSMFQILYDYLLMHCNFTPANQALGVYRNHPHLSIGPFVRASI